MPSFRSQADVSSATGFIFRSELPVASRLGMLPFFPQAMRVKKTLDQNIASGDGLRAYELVADLRAKRFTVASAWADEDSFRAWVGTEAHVAAMSALRSRVDSGTFETETVADTPASAGQ